MLQFKIAGKQKNQPQDEKHHFSIGTTLGFNLCQSLTEVFKHEVTSESQFTTDNTKLKISPKIPLNFGITLAFAPWKDKP